MHKDASAKLLYPLALFVQRTGEIFYAHAKPYFGSCNIQNILATFKRKSFVSAINNVIVIYSKFIIIFVFRVKEEDLVNNACDIKEPRGQSDSALYTKR